MKRNYYLVVDTETANSLENPLPYDIGYQVIDKKGNVYCQKSYAIAEIFNDKELMNSAYYRNKLPLYYNMLQKKEMQKTSIWNIRRELFAIIEKYDIKEVYAYNAYFDINALNTLVRYLTGSGCRYFFPYGIQICDIWNIACQVLGTQKTFQWDSVKNKNNHFITTAERMYSYIEDTDFKEQHTGLADVIIESKILVRCFKSHKKIDKKINRFCWNIPNKVAA